jgi:Cu/Ag efflux protein CusF
MKPLIFALLIIISICTACRSEKGRYALHGRVVKKDPNANTVTINSDEIPGFMGAMTMTYKVRDSAQLQKVEPGDVISADLITTRDSDGSEYWLETIRVLDSTRRRH